MTHGWWWNGYIRQGRATIDEEGIQIVRKYVAKEDGGEDSDRDMKAIGSKVQTFANSGYAPRTNNGNAEHYPTVNERNLAVQSPASQHLTS